MIDQNKHYLITSKEPFVAADGFSYKAVYGLCTLHKTVEEIGFKPIRSSDWIVKIRDNDDTQEFIFPGCQVLHIIKEPKISFPKDYKGEILFADGNNPQFTAMK